MFDSWYRFTWTRDKSLLSGDLSFVLMVVESLISGGDMSVLVDDISNGSCIYLNV